MPLRLKPQVVDPEESLAQLYEILRDNEKAAQMYEQIIRIMAEEWGFTEGESVEIHRPEIERLRK